VRKPKVLFVCPYPENVAPSQRLKFEQYYNHFREAGFDLDHKSFISASFWKIIYKKGYLFQKAFYTIAGYFRRLITLFTLSRYDIVYVHLWVTPFGPPFFEWLYRTFSKRLIYDIDDLIYLGNVKSKAHPLVGIIKGIKKPLYLMKAADHVITCTPHLDKFVRRYNNNTTDISSTINTSVYIPKTDYKTEGKFIIGWSGSYSTSKYLHLLDDVLKDLAKQYDFELVVMGDEQFQLDGVQVRAIAWKEEYEVEVIRKFDIGLYPLPNEEWVLGKSGLKALQYMALGVPTIATAIGTIFRIIQDGENGFLAKDNSEWKQHLISLIIDQKLRESTGRNAADTVEKNYSVKANKDTYLAILQQGFVV
jgi:glycosyltransferase involved in cell wall biosynthesis